MRKQIIHFIPAAILSLVLVSCGSDTKKPGKIYMPDMTYSNAYETYSASEIATPEGINMSARKPVAGTIPYGYIPNDPKIKTNQQYLMSYVIKNHYTHEVSKWQEEFDRAGVEIKNPIEATAESLEEGKRLYNINCSPCHGEKGEGNGQLVELPDGGDGPYTSRPPAYKTRLPEVNDGQIFYVVSYGKNMMGGYGFQLSVNERWHVINYIKKLGGVSSGAVVAAVDTTAKK